MFSFFPEREGMYHKYMFPLNSIFRDRTRLGYTLRFASGGGYLAPCPGAWRFLSSVQGRHDNSLSRGVSRRKASTPVAQLTNLHKHLASQQKLKMLH